LLDCLSHEIATKLKSQLSYTFSASIFSRLGALTSDRDFVLMTVVTASNGSSECLFGYLAIWTNRFFVVARTRAHEEMRLIRFLAIDTGRECNQKIPTSCSAQVRFERVSNELSEVTKTPLSLSSQILSPKSILSLGLPLFLLDT
jgi:hypothetical protein